MDEKHRSMGCCSSLQWKASHNFELESIVNMPDDVEDFTELEDYDEIKEYLEQDPEKFEEPTNLPAFEPGMCTMDKKVYCRPQEFVLFDVFPMDSFTFNNFYCILLIDSLGVYY